MSSEMIDGLELLPADGTPAKSAVVLLHGYGADAHDLLPLAQRWQEALPHAAFLIPNAPEHLPGGIVSGRQWFALQARDPQEYKVGAEAAAPRLHAYISDKLAQLNLGADALAIAGFSQGGMMAFQLGLHHSPQPKVILCFSGLLPGLGQFDQMAGSRAPTIQILHGEDDEVVPSFHAEGACQRLQALNYAVELALFPGVGHWIDEIGEDRSADFLLQHLG